MKIAGKLYTGIIFALLYIPIIVIIVFSFNSSESMAEFSGFSLKWYGELFKNDKAIDALINSLILAVSSALIATVLGTAAAVGIYNIGNKKLKSAIMTVTNIPMMNPDIVTGVSIMLLFAFGATLLNLRIFGFWTMLIAHVTFNLPYVILCVMPKLKQMDKNLPEAAMDLGCTPLQAFFKAEIFELLPGIATGLLMSFTLSLDDFVISYFVAGESFQTLPIYIYSMTKKRVKPDMNALFAVIFLVIFILLLARNLLTKDKNQVKKPVNR
ncbi:MAG: ABC transporter permease [Eubacteriales bacterium]|jgi:spermidine/putrescine transport system permease protein